MGAAQHSIHFVVLLLCCIIQASSLWCRVGGGRIGDRAIGTAYLQGSTDGDDGALDAAAPKSKSKSTPRERVPTTADLRWEVRPVGVIESPYYEKFNTPKQATISNRDGGAQPGKIRLFPEFYDCLTCLEGFDYIWVITLMHLNSGYKTKIRPQPRPEMERPPPSEVGLFCSRAPHRPNPIALSCLKVVSVDVASGTVSVLGLDLLHDTPVLDIKPYISAFDAFPQARAGWMDDITSSPEDGRANGYQVIRSSRGMRMARRSARRTAEQGPADAAAPE